MNKMYPQQHLFFGIIFSIFLFILSPKIGIIGILIILSATIFIDVDHYIYYIYKKKDFNLINAYRNSIEKTTKLLSLPRKKRNNIYPGFYFLHGVEILFFILAFSFFSKYFLFVFMGFSLHLLLDIVHQTTYWDRIDKFSLVYDYIKFKNKKSIF